MSETGGWDSQQKAGALMGGGGGLTKIYDSNLYPVLSIGGRYKSHFHGVVAAVGMSVEVVCSKLQACHTTSTSFRAACMEDIQPAFRSTDAVLSATVVVVAVFVVVVVDLSVTTRPWTIFSIYSV